MTKSEGTVILNEQTRFYSPPATYVMAKFPNTWPDRPDMADVPADLSFLITPEQMYHRIVRDWLKTNGS